jgi:hypothetical protein
VLESSQTADEDCGHPVAVFRDAPSLLAFQLKSIDNFSGASVQALKDNAQASHIFYLTLESKVAFLLCYLLHPSTQERIHKEFKEQADPDTGYSKQVQLDQHGRLGSVRAQFHHFLKSISLGVDNLYAQVQTIGSRAYLPTPMDEASDTMTRWMSRIFDRLFNAGVMVATMVTKHHMQPASHGGQPPYPELDADGVLFMQMLIMWTYYQISRVCEGSMPITSGFFVFMEEVLCEKPVDLKFSAPALVIMECRACMMFCVHETVSKYFHTYIAKTNSVGVGSPWQLSVRRWNLMLMQIAFVCSLMVKAKSSTFIPEYLSRPQVLDKNAAKISSFVHHRRPLSYIINKDCLYKEVFLKGVSTLTQTDWNALTETCAGFILAPLQRSNVIKNIQELNRAMEVDAVNQDDFPEIVVHDVIMPSFSFGQIPNSHVSGTNDQLGCLLIAKSKKVFDLLGLYADILDTSCDRVRLYHSFISCLHQDRHPDDRKSRFKHAVSALRLLIERIENRYMLKHLQAVGFTELMRSNGIKPVDVMDLGNISAYCDNLQRAYLSPLYSEEECTQRLQRREDICESVNTMEAAYALLAVIFHSEREDIEHGFSRCLPIHLMRVIFSRLSIGLSSTRWRSTLAYLIAQYRDLACFSINSIQFNSNSIEQPWPTPRLLLPPLTSRSTRCTPC